MNFAKNHQAPNKEVLPVFCFDPRIFQQNSITKYGTVKTGLTRSRFILESVENLRSNLRKINSDLLVTNEKPEDFIPKLVSDSACNTVVY